MKCGKCGVELSEETKVCPECGNEISGGGNDDVMSRFFEKAEEKIKNETSEDGEKAMSKFCKAMVAFSLFGALAIAMSIAEQDFDSMFLAIGMTGLFLVSYLMGSGVIKVKKVSRSIIVAIVGFVMIIPYFTLYSPAKEDGKLDPNVPVVIKADDKEHIVEDDTTEMNDTDIKTENSIVSKNEDEELGDKEPDEDEKVDMPEPEKVETVNEKAVVNEEKKSGEEKSVPDDAVETSAENSDKVDETLSEATTKSENEKPRKSEEKAETNNESKDSLKNEKTDTAAESGDAILTPNVKTEEPYKSDREVAQQQSVEGEVYITPTGKKYHLSKSCAGKNAIPKTMENVRNSYDPCKKCAMD